jgi:ATP-dependent DNA ligase
MGLEGMVSKRVNGRYRSGRSTEWLKTKCFATSEFILVGVAQEPKGPPVTLLASEENGRLRHAGTAFIGLTSGGSQGLLVKDCPVER